MIRKLIYIIILTIIWSCNQSADKKENTNQTEKILTDTSTDEISNTITFDYSKFEIKKGNLGEIKIGMTISEAEQKFEGLRKEIGEATSFGFGGGSPAYLYYDKDDLAFGLIPTLSTDTLLIIIAASPKFKTINGLNPNSEVKEISKLYPKAKVYQNLMNSWEEISDTINDWDFIFMTDEKTVGEYHKLETPSELKNMNIKADWITIK
ncbi:hypothetical protein [Tenacibaculum sp. SG-28]|uniref:hypothetical protein n=1 Tax=Tenacibaculum sp. SG-28 TaxID=754426 RepID=UPI000CF4EAC9|nr:hypothetical protein [Tenacibaculum sp. SG-28]PQJ18725.1 hypothetical protein BSU00_12610 [Tenacibaculum sp. SG-28]